MKTVAPAILDGLAEYDSATVQNAAAIVYGGYISEHVDYSGPDLKPYLWNQDGTGKAVVGYAMTSTWKPIHGIGGRSQDPSGRWEYYDEIAHLDAPTIVVQKDIDNPRRRAAILGDEMAHQMAALGTVGVVVDGNARDIPGINRAGLSLWATGRVPGHAYFAMIDHSIPVDIAGLRIVPGDILVCDSDGVTRVPVEAAEDILKQCAEVREREAATFAYFSKPNFTIQDWQNYTPSWRR